MRKNGSLVFSAVAVATTLSVLPAATSAATIGLYDFTSGSVASSDTEPLTIMSSVTRGAGIPNSAFTNDRFEVGGDDTAFDTSNTTVSALLTDAINNNYYFTFALTIPSGIEVDLAQLQYDYSALAPFEFAVGVFTDESAYASSNALLSRKPTNGNSTTPIAYPNETVDLSGVAFQNLTNTTLTFRIYTMDDSTVNTRVNIFDNVELFGTVTVVPEPTSLALLGMGGLTMLRRRRD